METDKRGKLRPTRTINLKIGSPESKKQEILEYFNKTFSLYEELFTLIHNDEAFYIKAEPLRHPLIFYYGHTATFFMNKFILGGYLTERVNPKFESMFAVGVDEMDWDDLNEAHYDWPSVKEVKEYRNSIRKLISKKIKETPLTLPLEWDSFFWLVMMGIEHERIHLETSAVIMRRLPEEYVHSDPFFFICPHQAHSGYNKDGTPNINKATFPTNELKRVEGGIVVLGKDDSYYGWDNEYGTLEEKLRSFDASVYLVSNYEYLEFVEDNGYDTEEYWTEEGWRWNRSTRMKRPLFWIPFENAGGKACYKYRAFTEVIEMPWDWPVETNYLESKAFCNWKAKKTGKNLRLPTETEWYRLRDMLYEGVDQPTWDFASVGNINLEQWSSSCPVNLNGKKGFYDVIGNVWQHTETTFDGFNGFKIHELYDDFSTPTFDGNHNLIKGGSWISTGNEALRNSRYAFRRHFYQFAGIRYVESENPVIVRDQKYETDKTVTEYIEFHYGPEYLGVENFPKKCAEICAEAAKSLDIPLRKAMDLGCAVGRTTFELAKSFEEVIGIDLSARFFQFAVRVKEKGKVRYCVPTEGDLVEYKEFDLTTLDLERFKDKIQFFQQDACNMDLKKFHSFDLIFAGNLLDCMKYPRVFLKNIHQYLNKGGLLVLACPYAWDEQYTEKENWIGAKKKDGENYTTAMGIKDLLASNFKPVLSPKNVPFVLRETKRKFQYAFSEMLFYQKYTDK